MLLSRSFRRLPSHLLSRAPKGPSVLVPRCVCFSTNSSNPTFAAQTVSLSQQHTILHGYVKKLYRLVHPDLFSFDPFLQSQNSQSMAALNSIFDYTQKLSELAEQSASNQQRIASSVGEPPARQRLLFHLVDSLKPVVPAPVSFPLSAAAVPPPAPHTRSISADFDIPSHFQRSHLAARHVFMRIFQLLDQARIVVTNDHRALLSIRTSGLLEANDNADSPFPKVAPKENVDAMLIKSLRKTRHATAFSDLRLSAQSVRVPRRYRGLELNEMLLPLMIEYNLLTFDSRLSAPQQVASLQHLQRLVKKHFQTLQCEQWPASGLRLHVGSEFSEPTEYCVSTAETPDYVRPLLRIPQVPKVVPLAAHLQKYISIHLPKEEGTTAPEANTDTQDTDEAFFQQMNPEARRSSHVVDFLVTKWGNTRKVPTNKKLE